MKLKDFCFFDPLLHCVHFIDKKGGALDWKVGEEIQLVSDRGALVIAQGDLLALARANESRTVDLALTRLSLWRLAQKGADHLHIEHASFQTQLSLDLKIAVDAYLSEQLHSNGLVSENTTLTTNEWLRDEFILELNEPYIIARYFKSQHNNDFQLIGKNYTLSIVNERNVWKAKRLTKLRRDTRDIIAITGNTEFLDASVAAKTRTSAVDALNQLVKDSIYLKLWETYNKIQWNIATRSAKKLGYFSYKEVFHTGMEIPRFRFNIGEQEALEFSKRIKELQDNEEFVLADLVIEIAAKPPEWMFEETKPSVKATYGEKPLLGREIRVRPPYIELEVRQSRPPKTGELFMSIQGDKSAYERREQAHTSIQTYNNPMPQLRRLIEGIEPLVERRRTLNPLSPKAKKLFKGEPTLRQKEALKIALNTPDIALIIGPPGTGKTQVITALQQRIADEFTDTSPVKHQVLLSSFQHDAVDNVVERSGVFGLPAVKVGGRRFGGETTESSVTKWRISKIQELKRPLESEMNSWPVFSLYEQLKDTALSLRMSRETGLRRTLVMEIEEILTQLSDEHNLHLSQDLSDEWQETYEKLRQGNALILSRDTQINLLKRIRGLRSSLIAFNDDGVDRVKTLLEFAEKVPCICEHKVIEQLSESIDQFNQSMLSDVLLVEKINVLKDQLIDAVRPDYRPFLLRSYIDKTDCKVLDKLESEIYELISKSRTLGPLLVRHEYLESLKNNTSSVEDSIKDYVTVLGATCQQAAGDKMLSIKSTSDRLGVTFDTVIVDEAARASPLDLMIPMAMAKRRIVLVGDHLQLPHMLEPRVEVELQEHHEIDEVKSELLRISLFEHLHHQFVRMHKNGGPQRVVMLDTQFRMHSDLGSFVSQEFYERRGFNPIESLLDNDHFEHEIDSYRNCIAAWVDVPGHKESEKSKNGSKYRVAEAKRCAEEAWKILSAHPNLSIGVITFYSAQRDVIYEELAAYGCANLSENGWQISSDYRLNSDGAERLRVGSVDAFQGKEFDVVILSAVRTWNAGTEMTIDNLNQNLGFLRLPNRINVAMSRQKMLLIVVGDKELRKVNGLNPVDNMPLLPGFPAFYKLCEGENGKIL